MSFKRQLENAKLNGRETKTTTTRGTNNVEDNNPFEQRLRTNNGSFSFCCRKLYIYKISSFLYIFFCFMARESGFTAASSYICIFISTVSFPQCLLVSFCRSFILCDLQCICGCSYIASVHTIFTLMHYHLPTTQSHSQFEQTHANAGVSLVFIGRFIAFCWEYFSFFGILLCGVLQAKRFILHP